MPAIVMTTVAEQFLQCTDICDPFDLFSSYAQHLLHSSDAWALPVPLAHIRTRHELRRHARPLPQRGFLLGDAIFINSDDSHAVQRFTEAHEFMEALFRAIRSESPSRFAKQALADLWPDKERWCEHGAAELLLPYDLFKPLVKGVSLDLARTLAGHCQTSLTATLRRMLQMDLEPCVFVLLKKGYKKSQVVPSKDGQLVLWGDPEDWDPPAELRVWRRWASPQVNRFVCPNESMSRDTLIYQTLSGPIGRVRRGGDDLDMEYIKGSYDTESMKVVIDGDDVVIALLHL